MGRSEALLKQSLSVFLRSMRLLAKCHPTVHLGGLQEWQTEGLAVRCRGEEFGPHTRGSADQEGGCVGPQKGGSNGLSLPGRRPCASRRHLYRRSARRAPESLSDGRPTFGISSGMCG